MTTPGSTNEGLSNTNNAPDAFIKKARQLGKMLNILAQLAPNAAGKYAFQIFCTPRKQTLREQDASFLNTANQSSFVAGKSTIKVYEWDKQTKPDAKTILFLHGWESSSARWKKYIKGLAKLGYRVHAFDAPAHGQSSGKRINLPLYSKVIATYMEIHGAPYAMVGHSLGGAALIMSMTLMDAPKVQKAVVMAGFAESSRVLSDFSRILGLNDTVSKHMSLEIERRSGASISAYSVTQKATELANQVQGLVIHDRLDPVAPVEEGWEIARAWQAQMIETNGYGHRLQDKTVVDLVLQFLSSE
jgi:pimeloyl-ACP methyl ester carboxylesterase